VLPEVRHFVESLEVESVSKDLFVSSTMRYISPGTSLTNEELAMVFDYVDLDMSGGLSTQELEVQLSALSTVVYPI
jgi:hypothetical protein